MYIDPTTGMTLMRPTSTWWRDFKGMLPILWLPILLATGGVWYGWKQYVAVTRAPELGNSAVQALESIRDELKGIREELQLHRPKAAE